MGVTTTTATITVTSATNENAIGYRNISNTILLQFCYVSSITNITILFAITLFFVAKKILDTIR